MIVSFWWVSAWDDTGVDAHLAYINPKQIAAVIWHPPGWNTIEDIEPPIAGDDVGQIITNAFRDNLARNLAKQRKGFRS
jgi:hypothetical protein